MRDCRQHDAVPTTIRLTLEIVKEIRPIMPMAELLLDQIRPAAEQPRKSFYNDSLEELAASIRERGVLEPIVVRPIAPESGTFYEIVMGERRFRASKLAGRETIPAIIKEMNDEEASVDALLENFQREDLNPIDKARAVQKLLSMIGAEKTSRSLGISNAAIRRILELLELPDSIQQELVCGPAGASKNAIFVEGHARALLSLNSDQETQALLTAKIKNEKISVVQTEQIVHAIRQHPSKKQMFLQVSGGVSEQIARSLAAQEERSKPYRIPSPKERLKSIDKRMNALTEMLDPRIVEHLSLQELNSLLSLVTLGSDHISALAAIIRAEIGKQDLGFSDIYTHCPLCSRIELVGSLRCSVCQTILRRCFDCVNYSLDTSNCRVIPGLEIPFDDAEDPLEDSQSYQCRKYKPKIKPKGMALSMANAAIK